MFVCLFFLLQYFPISKLTVLVLGKICIHDYLPSAQKIKNGAYSERMTRFSGFHNLVDVCAFMYSVMCICSNILNYLLVMC